MFHEFVFFEVIDVNIAMMDTLVIPKVLLQVFEDLVNYVVAVEISIRIPLVTVTRMFLTLSLFEKESNFRSFA